jgi:hypothetical protein
MSMVGSQSGTKTYITALLGGNDSTVTESSFSVSKSQPTFCELFVSPSFDELEEITSVPQKYWDQLFEMAYNAAGNSISDETH